MSNLHKIFRQLSEYPTEDIWRVRELLEELNEAKHDFEYVGAAFTYDNFKEYYKRKHKEHIKSDPAYHTPFLKILEGDNLDIIEKAAEEKGLIPKE